MSSAKKIAAGPETRLARPAILGAERITIASSPRLRVIAMTHALLVALMTPIAVVSAALVIARYGFSWADLALALLAHGLYATVVSVALHRYFSHRAFQVGRGLEIALAILAMSVGQGSLIFWVANHRRHHRHADGPHDPHSPNRQAGFAGFAGFVHGYLGWMFRHELTNPNVFARDLLRDALLVRLNRYYGAFVLLGLLLPSLAGWLLIGGMEGVLRGLVWGGLVRLASVYNSTFAVNALCHLFGSRRFDTPDNSRNLAWLSVLTAGDGWHNNHHGRPNAACFSMVWWEIDPGYLVILGLKRLGLARNLNG